VTDQPFVVDQAPQFPRARAASLIGPRGVARPRVEGGFVTIARQVSAMAEAVGTARAVFA
jgi:hypothetical protein